MSQPAPTPEPMDPSTDARVRRETIRRRFAEQGIIVQLPAEGGWTPPAQPFPASADELSEAVILMRRGED